MSKFDLKRHVTDQIIDMIEEAQKSENTWEKPWVSFGNERPINPTTGNPYNGMNWFWLSLQPFPVQSYASLKQWSGVKRRVKKEHLKDWTMVFFYKPTEITDKATGDTKTIPFVRYSKVYNESLLEDFEMPSIVKPNEAERIAHVERFIENTGAKIIYSSTDTRAYFAPGPDVVNLPAIELFKATKHSTATENFQAVRLHEMTHWTGHKSRLDRTFGNKFGDKLYAFEELVAELGASFACAELGITNTPRKDHAEYLASWLKGLKEDKNAIFRAASQAQKAFDYMNDMQ